MASYKQISQLVSQNKVFYDSKDLSIFFNVTGRTLENIIKRLLDQEVLTYLEKGKYYVTSKQPNEMQIAHFVYNPSYISFETALNYYGILSQFPTLITSATTRKTTSKIINGKEYVYSHISTKCFTGYEKGEGFLIALPEKALVDQLYFSLKSLKSVQNLDEYELSHIDMEKVTAFANLMDQGIKGKIIKLLQHHI